MAHTQQHSYLLIHWYACRCLDYWKLGILDKLHLEVLLFLVFSWVLEAWYIVGNHTEDKDLSLSLIHIWRCRRRLRCIYFSQDIITVEISLLGLSFYFFDSSFSSETVNCSCNKKECRCVCLQCCVYVTVFKHSPPTKITDSNLVPDSFIKMPIRYWVMIHSHHYFWLESSIPVTIVR